MKKLMTVMASAATALFAIGAVNGDPLDSPLGTSFEGYETRPFSPWADDTGNTANNGYWYMDKSVGADTGTVLTSEVAAVTVPRPDMYTNVANSTALSLDTSSPLFRTVDVNDGEGLPDTGAAIGDGIYLDTLVKFTAADDVFGENALAQGDKIAISYVEQGDDVANPITNFVICAGYIKGAQQIVATNYVAMLPDDMTFDKEAWHRLTVRTLPSINNANHVGFVVYVDETALVYAEENVKIGDGDYATASVADALKDSVFPSAVAVGDDKTTITAASFSGTGAIDDVVFTKVTPNFILTGEAVVVPFVADAGVKAISVEVKGDVVTNIAVTAAGTYAATLEAQTTAFTVNVTVDEANDYTLGSISYNGTPLVNGEVTGYAGGNITITTIRNNFNVFDTNGDPITTGAPFQTLSQALAADGVAKIQLAYDYDVAANEGTQFGYYSIESDVVLDLNGKTLVGVANETKCLFDVAVNKELIVINSVNSDDGKIVYNGASGVFGGEGNVTIGSITLTDYGPVVDGPVIGKNGYVAGIYRGKFLASVNTTEAEEFVCSTEDEDAGIDVVDSDSTVTLVNGYWVVKPNGGDEPEGYDNGGGGTFVIAAATETALKANLPAGKTLASAVSETSSMTYAQAYALGLWDAEAKEVAELEATISVGADGKVTVSLANEPADGYLVQCKVYEKASLAAEWPTEAKATYAYGSEQAFTPGSANAGFYKVAVVISNSVQQ